jgi:sialate O-acetylesterase
MQNRANLCLSPFYSDGMVIQRGEPFPVRGRGAQAAAVTVAFRGKTYTARAGANGAWRLVIPALPAGGPWTLEIVSDGETVLVRDIYAGDVWFCGGQSNMELQMPRVRDAFPEEWDRRDYPLVREFRIPQEWDFRMPRDELAGGTWRRLSKDTINMFSAATYFFARKYAEEHRVAVGLVNASWGGSPAEAWMSREDVTKTYPYKAEHARMYADDAFRENALAAAREAVAAWDAETDKADTGNAEHWETGGNGAGDDGWREAVLPSAFDEIDGLKGFCGVLWFKRTFTAGKEFAGKPLRLWLGTVTDSDKTCLNGVQVGSTAYRYPPRKYTVPPGLVREGENTIVVRVVCNNGQGAFTRDKPYMLFDGNVTDGDAGTAGDAVPAGHAGTPEAAKISLAGSWRYKIGAKRGPRPEELFLNREASGLYNAMIYPAREFPVKGILYYQAESNDGKPEEYELLFKTLITGWRTIRARPDLPFVFAQLPVWGEPSDNDETHSWAKLRAAQQAALSLPRTAMAVCLDAGEWNDLHPVDKKTVGERLFLAVEKLVFGADNSSPGPLPLRHEVKDGLLTITFAHCAGGLTARTPVVLTAVADGVPRALAAKITGSNTLQADLGGLKPERVLYAWANTPKHAGLFNRAGLPAAPFHLPWRP